MGKALYRKSVSASGYQQWTGYPDSPLDSTTDPYQILTTYGGNINLYLGNNISYTKFSGGTYFLYHADGTFFKHKYRLDAGVWVYIGDSYIIVSGSFAETIIETNCNIFNKIALSTIYFSKTTTPAQDAGITTSLVRVRNLRHKDGASLVRDKGVFWNSISGVGLYQRWIGYGDSPVLTSEFPYQVIIGGTTKFLIVSLGKFYHYNSQWGSVNIWYDYYWDGSNWIYNNSHSALSTAFPNYQMIECNNDVYADSTLTSVSDYKTTTDTYVQNYRINT